MQYTKKYGIRFESGIARAMNKIRNWDGWHVEIFTDGEDVWYYETFGYNTWHNDRKFVFDVRGEKQGQHGREQYKLDDIVEWMSQKNMI